MNNPRVAAYSLLFLIATTPLLAQGTYTSNGDSGAAAAGALVVDAARATNRLSFLAMPASDNSLKLDAAGNPVIAFWDDRASLMLAHCANPTCSSGTSIDTVDTGQVFAEVSLALNSSGNPVISYFFGNLDGGQETLRIATCGDPNCSAGNVIAVPDQSGGLASSLLLDSAGNPVVSYTGGNGIQLLHCTVPNCTSGNIISTVDAGSNYGNGSLALDSAGNPVISYTSPGVQQFIKLAHCSDPNCSASTINSIDSSGGANTDGTALVLDAAGNPVITYFRAGREVAHCADPNCSANTVITRVDAQSANGERGSIVLDQSGKPIISYTVLIRNGHQVEDHLAVLHCGDANCSTGNSIVMPDVQPITGPLSSLQLDRQGRPVISYQRIADLINPALYVLHCARATCN
jgi:hypothetical protein